MKKSRHVLIVASLAFVCLASQFSACQSPKADAAFTPAIPKTWDEERLASIQVALAVPAASAAHLSAEYYYRIPVRPIYRSYPVYHPDKEPAGYLEWLKRQKPEVVWDDPAGLRPALRTEADWLKAGELVFDAPIDYDTGFIGRIITFEGVRDREWYRRTGMPLTADVTLPFVRYVIRTNGIVEVGNLSCAFCHTRVLGNTILKGAQGNLPFDRAIAAVGRADAATTSPDAELVRQRFFIQLLFDTPWLNPDPHARLKQIGFDELLATYEAIPGGVLARHGTAPDDPVQVPDLIGVKERRYLDRTGLIRHRDIADVMRYAALNQGGDLLARHGDFIPGGVGFKQLPDPTTPEVGGRYSDEQLYALALYLYYLQPPVNPNLPKTVEQHTLVARGKAIFHDSDNRCATCHKPPLYTNNKLTPAPGFSVREDHSEGTNIMPRSVGTDPRLALTTRRGTGFYKVPSLLGVWYRGPFEHNGSCATLEDLFDPARTNENYVPTGWKGPPGTKTRAVKGHEFGLDLSEDERKALIAFLRTL